MQNTATAEWPYPSVIGWESFRDGVIFTVTVILHLRRVKVAAERTEPLATEKRSKDTSKDEDFLLNGIKACLSLHTVHTPNIQHDIFTFTFEYDLSIMISIYRQTNWSNLVIVYNNNFYSTSNQNRTQYMCCEGQLECSTKSNLKMIPVIAHTTI